jgi:hypothetical protein
MREHVVQTSKQKKTMTREGVRLPPGILLREKIFSHKSRNLPNPILPLHSDTAIRESKLRPALDL